MFISTVPWHAPLRSRCAWCRIVTRLLGACSGFRRGPDSIDRVVGHHAVPLEIGDLRPGRPVPGELNRLRNRRVPRRRAANDRGNALSARTARLEPIGIGVLHLSLTGRHASPILWTNDERDRVVAVQDGGSAEAVGGSDRAIASDAAHKPMRRLRRSGVIGFSSGSVPIYILLCRCHHRQASRPETARRIAERARNAVGTKVITRRLAVSLPLCVAMGQTGRASSGASTGARKVARGRRASGFRPPPQSCCATTRLVDQWMGVLIVRTLFGCALSSCLALSLDLHCWSCRHVEVGRAHHSVMGWWASSSIRVKQAGDQRRSGVRRILAARSAAFRPGWLANDDVWGCRALITCGWGHDTVALTHGVGVGLGFPKQVDTTDSSNDCHLCRGRNQHPLREFPHHLLLIRGSSDPSAGERLEIREIWRSLTLRQYVLDIREDQCFPAVFPPCFLASSRWVVGVIFGRAATRPRSRNLTWVARTQPTRPANHRAVENRALAGVVTG